MNSKHAYLFIINGNIEVLLKCLSVVDDIRNDIYLLPQYKKSQELERLLKNRKLKYSNVYIIKPDFVITWSGTLYKAELELLKASAKKHYDYYHLLSESCFPIKTQDQIHDFFDKDTDRKLYMHVNYLTFDSIQERCKTRYPFVNFKLFRRLKLLKLIALIIVKLKVLFGVNRLKDNKYIPIIFNGWNWFSIPDDFVQFVIENEGLLHQTFAHTLAADEVFLQSLAMNSRFKDRMYGYNGKDDAKDASKRYIISDRKKWHPHAFDIDDFDLLIDKTNPCFFARKLLVRNMDLVDKLVEYLKR